MNGTFVKKVTKISKIAVNYCVKYHELIFHLCVIRMHIFALRLYFDLSQRFPYPYFQPLRQNQDKN